MRPSRSVLVFLIILFFLPCTIGTSNEYMGLTNSSYITTIQEEQESLIAFEFDTNFDLELGDINDNHVGLDINTIFSFASENANSVGVDLKAGRPMKGWVEYKNEDKLIKVWIIYSRFRPSNPVLVTHVDLSNTFHEFMYVGFSAPNEQGMALHLIDKWSFRTFRFKPNSVSSNNNNDNPVVADDSGSVDKGEDNGDSLLAEQRRRRRKRVLVFAGGTTEFLFSMAGIAVAGWYIVKKKRKNGMQSCRLEEIRRVPTRVPLPSRFFLSLKMRSSTSVFVILIILLLLPRLSSLSQGSTQRTSITFVYSPSTNITLIGDAYMRNGAMSLTRELGPSISSSGRALYAHPIRFLDATTNAPASFSSHFSFSIFPSPSSPFGDGLAFIITSNPRTIGTFNGYMGLTNSSSITTIQEEQESVIAFEFDTNFDLELGDINDNHVGLDINTIFSFASENANSVGVDLKAGRPMKAWVEYKNEDKLARVWISYSRFRPSNPVLITHVDLSDTFHEFMYVGFSASNGQGMALHLIDKWSFRTFGFKPNSVSNNNDNGNPVVDYDGGFVDMGEDNGDTLLAEQRRRRRRKRELGFAGGTAAFLFSMAGIAGAGWYIVKKKRRNGMQSCRVEEITRVPTRVSLTEIKAATRGFDCEKIIGEGASGTVYQGVLRSGNAVAVKRFGRTDKFTNTFATELTANLGCLRHKNLVQIQGWCIEKNEFLLLYEHMANGSLDKFLHPPPPPAPPPLILSWENRLKIVLGVASALSYLHYECEKQIIHRDVKACNIMLNAEFNAKLGDFGLAELKEHDISPQVTIPAGTMGYLAPEYVYSGVLSEKTDVYSFGVLALEVGTGKRPIDERFVLVDWVWGMWGMGKLVEAADRQLEGRFNKEEMYRMLVVGISCVHPDCNQRPNMPNAIKMLKGEAPLPLLPSHKPAAIRLLSLVHDDYECQGDNSSVRRYRPPNSNTTNEGQRGGEIRGCTSPTHWFTPCTSF
ncbi:L-type lectin-domain containing receptor kinase S.6-like [Tasmannia lanceolata]|uniref:L-type lectin-domain containing receptor kinase S.6-like n=1 Tax=Tasmannia lanceolata TaxID=3420 RepID=UPI0040646B3C